MTQLPHAGIDECEYLCQQNLSDFNDIVDVFTPSSSFLSSKFCHDTLNSIRIEWLTFLYHRDRIAIILGHILVLLAFAKNIHLAKWD